MKIEYSHMLYDQNPTLDKLQDKTHDESIQGQAYGQEEEIDTGKKKFYIESYGCQMNFSDSEIVASILSGMGFVPTQQIARADLI
ncbi:MAG TPA: tRNA (N6-isopentenyl adenosine(37)-C2)-methylthiotransferase MiaB, partial [Saprospiraceae bacterium]|nr:tRNA (N6-isopentenyl adenosine(37)-C2)-methylthiotransferase MiaB [Saprospiraceae bacterium]